MPLTVKNSPTLSRLGNNRGQSIIEYTLILIVTVAILLLLMNVMFKPFGEFISNYMGKYTACLLEYGELPSFGNDTPSEVDEDSECDKQFQVASWERGRPPAPQGGTTSTTSGKTTTTRRETPRSGSSYAGSSSRGGSSNINIGRRPSGGIEGGGAKRNGKVLEIALENNGSGGFFRSSRGERWSVNSQRTRSVGLTGLTEAEKKELEKKADGTAGVLKTGESIKPPTKKLLVKPPPIKDTVREDKPFTLGNFIRYLFIAALVIALVVFIGGQALQMSKSGEK